MEKKIKMNVSKNGEVAVDMETGGECSSELDELLKEFKKAGLDISVTNRQERDHGDDDGIPVKC